MMIQLLRLLSEDKYKEKEMPLKTDSVQIAEDQNQAKKWNLKSKIQESKLNLNQLQSKDMKINQFKWSNHNQLDSTKENNQNYSTNNLSSNWNKAVKFYLMISMKKKKQRTDSQDFQDKPTPNPLAWEDQNKN